MGKKRTVVVAQAKRKRAVISLQETKKRVGEMRRGEATSQPRVGLRRALMRREEVTSQLISQLRAGLPQKQIKQGAVERVAVAKKKP